MVEREKKRKMQNASSFDSDINVSMRLTALIYTSNLSGAITHSGEHTHTRKTEQISSLNVLTAFYLVSCGI